MRRLTLAVVLALAGLLTACTGSTEVEAGKGKPKTTIETLSQPNVFTMENSEGVSVEVGASSQLINGVFCITSNEGLACDFANDLGLNTANPGEGEF